MNVLENEPEFRQSSRSSSSGLCPHGEDAPEASLRSILNKLWEFRRDNMAQLSDIKQELKRANDRLDEAEGRIDETETVLQATSTLIKRLTQHQANLEARLIDQGARVRRDNLRIYGIPEDKEGTNMIGFLDNLLKSTLEFPQGQGVGNRAGASSTGTEAHQHTGKAPIYRSQVRELQNETGDTPESMAEKISVLQQCSLLR